ncbi:Lrp/AsnC family transcriptional regulator [Paeniglutamicibacter sp. MACA_103]|uniref:Lrp/AsnC family transcriptional regulator n=1 Tax=Paeniglutamicibacter sp. MACA_103 TaxID=3377337 RepID=UPI003893AE51
MRKSFKLRPVDDFFFLRNVCGKFALEALRSEVKMMQADTPLMDQTDLDVVAALQIAPRVPANILGEILGTPTSTITRRLNRLQNERLVKVVGRFAWPLILSGNPQQLWVRCLPGQVTRVAEQLRAFSEIQFVMTTSGSCDIYADLFPLHGSDINDLLSNRIPSLPGIKSVEARLVLDSRRVGQSWRTGRLSGAQTEALAAHIVPVNQPALRSMDELTDVEFGTLSELGRNARASAAEVSRTLDVSSSSTYRAIQMLLATGAISPRVEVEPSAVGFPVTAVISLQVKPKSIGAVLDRLATHDSARMISMVTGKAPVVFAGAFKGPAELAEFITRDIGALPGIQAMDTCVGGSVLRRYWMDREGVYIGEQVKGLLRR